MDAMDVAEEDDEEEDDGPRFHYDDDDSDGVQRGQQHDPQQQHRRVIVHIDLNAFYYQCEALLDPSLRGKPVGVQQVCGVLD
jgi:hypothetical protein